MSMYKTIQQYVACVTIGVTLCVADAVAETIIVPVGRSQLVDVSSDMTEVIVAGPNIADAYVHDKRKISVMGKSIGLTDVRILGESGVLRDFTVNVTYDLPAIRKALKEFMPDEDVGIEMLNSNMVLTGYVRDAAAAERAVQIVTEFVQPALENKASSGAGSSAQDNNKSKVINMLEIMSGQQVMLRVRVGEIRRSALKNLGLDLQAVAAGGNSFFQMATGSGMSGILRNGFTDGTGGFLIDNLDDVRGFASGGFSNSNGDSISGLLEALERDSLFKVLAEPNLVSLSGESSQFLAGGEIPVPVPNGNQQVTIEYKPYGVSVKFTPFVLSENRVRVAVQPEVSEISDEGALVFNGFTVPALITRRAQTVIELSPGESFMIAGLIQDELTSGVSSMPGVKEIPILGALFSSVSFQREETELVLAVTPYIVDPVVSSDIKLPTDDFRPASMMEMFFYGAIGSLNGGVDRLSQTPTIEGPVGFMVD